MEILTSDFLLHMEENYNKMKDLFRKKKTVPRNHTEINIEDGLRISNYMISKIQQKLANVDKSRNDYFRLLGMKVALLYEQSKQYAYIGYQIKAEDILQHTYTEYKRNIICPQLGYVMLRIINHLSFYLHLKDCEKAKIYLEEAEVHYHRMVQANPTLSWCTSNELFSSMVEISFKFSTKEKFEKVFINNMQLLSCIYFKQNDLLKYVLYQHEVLSKQLTLVDSDPSQWASKVSKLVVILLQLEMFKEARHHLSAASCVLEAHLANLSSCMPSPTVSSKEGVAQRTYADISRCWGKYGIKLLTVSKSCFFKQKYGEPNDFLNSIWTTPNEIVEIIKSNQEDKSTEAVSTLEEVVDSRCENTDTIEKIDSDLSQTIDTIIEVKIEDQCKGLDKSDEIIRESIEIIKESIDNLNLVRSNMKVIDDNEVRKLNEVDETCKTTIKDFTEDVIQVNAEGNNTYETVNVDPSEAFVLPEKNLLFTMIETSVFEKKVSADLITTTPEAHDLFLFSHFWVKKSKDYYSFQIHPEEYINAVLDLSELYRLLAFFDGDIEVQYKIQKRRSDTLEALNILIKELNPEVYMNVSIDLLRELAEVHIEMIRLNIGRMDTLGKDVEGMFHKMGAMTDIYSRLSCYKETLGHSFLFGRNCDTDKSFFHKLP